MTTESANGGQLPGLSSTLELGAPEQFPAMPCALTEAISKSRDECPYNVTWQHKTNLNKCHDY